MTGREEKIRRGVKRDDALRTGNVQAVARTCRGDAAAVSCADEGFMLIGAIVLVFMVLLVLSVAAPTIAKSIQRDREVESAHRAQQYVRAVRIFYQQTKHYPTSLEQLEKTNNRRYLRQRYIDPLTGKSDWRLIHVGENQTTVKGFFGEDLPGLQQGGLGSAAGMASTTGGGASTSAFGSGSPSAFGGSTPGAGGSTSAFGGSTSSPGGGSTSAFGSSGAPGQSGTGTSTGSSNGIASQDATSFTGSGGGPIIGVGSARSGEAMVVVNEQATYETWEFLYDPRIEALYAKSTLLGGVPSTSATGSSGFGSSPGTGTGGNGTSTFGNSFGNSGSGTSNGGAFGNSGTGTGTPTGTTPP